MPTATRPPLIRIESPAAERALKRQVPAWAISLALHAALFAVFALVNLMLPDRPGPEAIGGELQELQTKVEEEDHSPVDINPDIGQDPKLPGDFMIERIEETSVLGPLRPDEPPGNDRGTEAPHNLPPPPGLAETPDSGSVSGTLPGIGPIGEGMGMNGPPPRPGEGFPGRGGSARDRLLKKGGGNPATEACVSRGLLWLSRQQKPDGSWELDGSTKSKIAGTGIALLPYLAAGYTHKGSPKPAEGAPERGKLAARFPQQIDAGLKYLIGKQTRAGDFGTSSMYEHAIATMAVCEAYGMTADRRLLPHAQTAVDYIQAAQHPAGGWRYSPGQAGDTSVTGWQVQALKSAHLAGLKVKKDVLTRAGSFLDSVAGNTAGSTYGYAGKGNSPSMTAVGLLCRQYLGWGPKNPGLIAGVEELRKTPPRADAKDPRPMDVYYYYYATQVLHFYGGPDWHEFWNPRMRQWLIDLQVSGAGPNSGSWNPDGTLTGAAGGRVLTTSLLLLTLEVYYRHLPLYKRDAGAMKDLEGS